MEIMGWSDLSIAKRYMHVKGEVLTVVDQVDGLVWVGGDDEEATHQRACQSRPDSEAN